MRSGDTDLRVEAGAIVVLRLYEVAYGIDLPRVEQIAAAQVLAAVSRLRLTRAEPKAIAFGVPPVEIALGPIDFELDGSRRSAEVTARAYEFGVVSIAVRIPVTGTPWDEFVDLATAVDRSASSTAAAEMWSELLERVRRLIGPALERPSETALEEDYLLTIVRSFDSPVTADDILRRVDLVPLLAGERRELSEPARRELLRHSFSYYRNDLAVVTWDHAFIYEPSGDMDVADVLEVANAQLLELRYYDELLDAELPRMYERVKETRRGLRGLSLGRFANLARDLHTLVAEVTEITEKVDNTLKVTEDVYLARIYGTALELFRVPVWAASVGRKLDIIRETYTALYDEAATARAELLEAAIVLLIVLEIILAFVFG